MRIAARPSPANIRRQSTGHVHRQRTHLLSLGFLTHRLSTAAHPSQLTRHRPPPIAAHLSQLDRLLLSHPLVSHPLASPHQSHSTSCIPPVVEMHTHR